MNLRKRNNFKHFFQTHLKYYEYSFSENFRFCPDKTYSQNVFQTKCLFSIKGFTCNSQSYSNKVSEVVFGKVRKSNVSEYLGNFT